VASVYYFCATEFGWAQETVDKQTVTYLKNLFDYHKKVNNKVFNPPPLSKVKNQIRNFK